MIVTKNGAIGYGTFREIPWHKREKEDILANVGIKVEYGEQLQEPILKGTYKTVGDKEHVQIMDMYSAENLSMIDICTKLDRSSRTIKVHIDSHNRAVQRSGFCAACKRAQSAYANQEVGRACRNGK